MRRGIEQDLSSCWCCLEVERAGTHLLIALRRSRFTVDRAYLTLSRRRAMGQINGGERKSCAAFASQMTRARKSKGWFITRDEGVMKQESLHKEEWWSSLSWVQSACIRFGTRKK